MSYSPIFGSQPALGQLGGAWGWFSLWNLAFASPSFSGWIYTDVGTAQLLASAKHAAPTSYGIAPTKGAQWVELHTLVKVPAPLGGAFLKRGTHVSWIWPATWDAASLVDSVAMGQNTWTEIRDVAGRIVR
jgi:hypothetical protein